MRVTARPSHPLGALKETDDYIERPADADLLRSLQAGEPAYVLAARQTGKTYLLRRTQSKLMAQGYRCVKLDMGAFSCEDTIAQCRAIPPRALRAVRRGSGVEGRARRSLPHENQISSCSRCASPCPGATVVPVRHRRAPQVGLS